MLKKILFSAFIVAFSLSHAQQIDKQRLDDYFKALDDNHKVMGSFAIADKGKIIYSNAIGFSDVENKKKADVNTVYKIGSITKTFTATLVMKAVEDKKLTLDTRLSTFFPRIKNADQISIEYLLDHRSGIHNYTDDILYSTYYTQPVSEEKLVSIIENAGSDFQPGSKFSYSNSNYVLLGYILEKVYKKPYSELILKFISQPLNLKYTGVGGKTDTSKNQANSYAYENNGYVRSIETDMSVPGGAGCIISTPSELIAFMNGLVSGKIISRESVDRMRQYRDHYGLGLFEVPFYEKMGFGHNGGIDNFSSTLYYFPDGEKTVAIITNQSGFDNNNIAIAALSAAYGMNFDLPDFKVIALSEKELQQFTGNYSAPDMPLKFNIFIKDSTLMAQATGQEAFPLEATSKTSFKFDMAGIKIDFNPDQKQFVISQGSHQNTFTKE
ncbi:serine hydrolase domain-containing protein [Chryseobacterium gossypii]|uniref:serine hydrolase domain-containing protein n=1 Tax=Chryseobacterium gossypii TaxID=3231602 RepID=UPI0035268074